MNKTVLISLPIEDLQTVIIDCVNSCLRNNKQESKTPTEQPEQLLNIQEAAEFLKLTVPTLYSKVSKGELPVMKRSKRLYFSRAELLAYLKQGRKKSNAEIEQEAEGYLLNTKKGGLNNGK
jgi:excisionase family DNA binding protein